MTATITLRNAHGAYTVDVDRLSVVVLRTKTWDDATLRLQTEGRCGYPEGSDALRDCTRLELQVILTESGNF